jgi:colanic acid biosynthesis protein WcaH
MLPEPLPGARLSAEDFAVIVRLTPLVAMDLVVRDPDGRVLLGRRKNAPARGCLFVPGGRISKNETLAKAFRRITLTELGEERELTEARMLGAYDHLYPDNALQQTGYGTHYVTLAWELFLSGSGTALPHDQHDSYLWLSEAEILSRPDVHANTKAYFSAQASPDTSTPSLPRS